MCPDPKQLLARADAGEGQSIALNPTPPPLSHLDLSRHEGVALEHFVALTLHVLGAHLRGGGRRGGTLAMHALGATCNGGGGQRGELLLSMSCARTCGGMEGGAQSPGERGAKCLESEAKIRKRKRKVSEKGRERHPPTGPVATAPLPCCSHLAQQAACCRHRLPALRRVGVLLLLPGRVVVGVQVDLHHVQDGLGAPLGVGAREVELLEGFAGVIDVPAGRQGGGRGWQEWRWVVQGGGAAPGLSQTVQCWIYISHGRRQFRAGWNGLAVQTHPVWRYSCLEGGSLRENIPHFPHTCCTGPCSSGSRAP